MFGSLVSVRCPYHHSPRYKIELEVSSGPLTEMSYEEIIEALDREEVLRRFGLQGLVSPAEMEFITPEEYASTTNT